MRLIQQLEARFRPRLASLRRALRSDRGESPVPTAIIIVGLALLAVGVLTMAANAIDSWELLIPPAIEP